MIELWKELLVISPGRNHLDARLYHVSLWAVEAVSRDSRGVHDVSWDVWHSSHATQPREGWVVIQVHVVVLNAAGEVFQAHVSAANPELAPVDCAAIVILQVQILGVVWRPARAVHLRVAWMIEDHHVLEGMPHHDLDNLLDGASLVARLHCASWLRPREDSALVVAPRASCKWRSTSRKFIMLLFIGSWQELGIHQLVALSYTAHLMNRPEGSLCLHSVHACKKEPSWAS